MNKHIKKFVKDTEKLYLDEQERTLMKNRVFSYVQSKPTRQSMSPISGYLWYFSHKAFAIYGLILLLTFSSVTSAAEDSVPGDTLYPIKININESIVRTLSIGDEARAKTSVGFAERRLLEIERLVVDKRDSSLVLEVLRKQVKENTQSVHDYTDKIKSKNNQQSAIKIQSELEAVIDAHTKILEDIAKDSKDDEDSDEADIANILIDLDLHGDEAERSSEALEEFVRASSSDSVLMEIVADSIDDYQSDIKKLKKQINSGDENDLVEFEAESIAIEQVESMIEETKNKIETMDFKGAMMFSNDIGDILRETDALIRAQSDLGIDIDSDEKTALSNNQASVEDNAPAVGDVYRAEFEVESGE